MTNRFAAHGSPYYAPEKMEGVLAGEDVYEDLQTSLGVDIVMIHVDECLNSETGSGKCAGSVKRRDSSWTASCLNTLQIEQDPVVVLTNLTSFVGVNAFAQAQCDKCAAGTCSSSP